MKADESRGTGRSSLPQCGGFCNVARQIAGYSLGVIFGADWAEERKKSAAGESSRPSNYDANHQKSIKNLNGYPIALRFNGRSGSHAHLHIDSRVSDNISNNSNNNNNNSQVKQRENARWWRRRSCSRWRRINQPSPLIIHALVIEPQRRLTSTWGCSASGFASHTSRSVRNSQHASSWMCQLWRHQSTGRCHMSVTASTFSGLFPNKKKKPSEILHVTRPTPHQNH